MQLLFLNALKGLKKKKVQMIAIIFLVMLSSTIYTTMNTALDRLENRYYHYLDEQKVEDFAFTPVIDLSIDVTLEEIDDWKEAELKEMTEEEEGKVNQYIACLKKEDECSEQIYLNAREVFDIYGVTDLIVSKKLDPITKKYHFDYTLEPSKIISEDRYMIKVLPYQKDKKLNMPYLVEGRYPEADNEITVLPNFAKQNGYKIGDTYEMLGKRYKIVGFTYASDYIYPMISFNVPMFDEKYNNIIFMNESTYLQTPGIREDVYVGKFHDTVDRKQLNLMTGEDHPASKIYDTETNILELDMASAMRVMRINMLQTELNMERQFADYFLYLLLGISIFIIIIVMKKRIDDERLQIGVLKSLGYSSITIAVSYLVYPIVGSLIGGVIGYFIGTLLHGFLANMYLSYFTIPLAGYHFNLTYLGVSIFLPMIVLTILSYLIAIFMLRKKPLSLLKEGSNLKVNAVSRLCSKLFSKLSFHARFRYSLASRSLGKLLIVSITSFCTGLLIVLMLIGMNLFGSMIEKTFDQFSYQYMVIYQRPQMEVTEEKEDYLLELNMKVKEVLDENGNAKKLEEEDVSLTITGIDENPNYIEVKDRENHNLIPKLQNENTIIMNENSKEVMKLAVGDTLILTYNGKDYSYTIGGISESFMGLSSYVNRNELSELLGSKQAIYTKKLTTNERYGNVKELEEAELSNIGSILSLNDLRRNMEQSLKSANTSIYMIIAFASIMALVIIAVIANIVVEENKRTISLMKVMGYKNKHISSIVLNIYTPVVMLSYLLSIPVMIGFLKWIVSNLVSDMNMAIPIAISPMMALLGLIGLLIAYFIAITLSRRTLNKVPLAVALKRE